MDGGKSLYVIRIYEYSEYNYPVRKVSKRTSRDFLWAIDEVFALSAFTNVGVKLPCKKSKQKDVKRFPMGGGKSLYVIRFYEYSEYNYLVRKVSKRTSRDFLWAIEKVFTLSAFTNIASITTL